MRRELHAFCIDGKLNATHDTNAIAINQKPDYGFLALLKSCAKKKDLHEGSRLHAEIVKKGLLHQNPHLANTLVSMYAKCDALAKAEQVLEELPFRDIVTWNALITGYVQQMHVNEALNCFEQIQIEGYFADHVTFTCILKVSGRTKAINKGKQIHIAIMSRRLLDKGDIALGTALVDMYAKCGELEEAQEVLEELAVRNIVSWNALIAGYASHGQIQQVLNCLELIHNEGLFPDTVTYVCMLNTCGCTQALCMGQHVHYEVVSGGLLETDIVLDNALIDMYAKCGELGKACQVLQKLHDRDVVSWSSLISGYAQTGQTEEALSSFERMLIEGHTPDVVTFLCILKACSCSRDIGTGVRIHNEIMKRGLHEKDSVLDNALVDMYAKCGMLAKAKQMLQMSPSKDIVCWNALIAGYTQHGQGQEALECFECMQSEGLYADDITFIGILQACGMTGAIDRGKQIHEEITSRGLLNKDGVLMTALIDMYAKCGMLRRAQELLEELSIQDVVCWSAVISGYAQQGQGLEALNCFQLMQDKNVYTDAILFICILKAIGIMGAVEMGEEIHRQILNRGWLKNDVVLGNALIGMYAKCGALPKAHEVLDELATRDVVSWNTMIMGHAQQGQDDEALNCFDQMQKEGIYPDAATLVCVSNLCSRTLNVEMAEETHSKIAKAGFWNEDFAIGNALVGMYAKCALRKAVEAFEELPVRSIVVWNAIIVGFGQEGQSWQALNYFQQMRNEGVLPNVVTLAWILSSCGRLADMEKGKRVHCEILSRKEKLETDNMLGNALVDMYGKCGILPNAHRLLEELPVRDVVTWSALISGYVQHEQGREAFCCLQLMQSEGIYPDVVALTCILKACSYAGALEKGKQIHQEVVHSVVFKRDIVLNNALVDMYVKCGVLSEARKVLEEHHRLLTVVSSNALISGYAKQGQGREALNHLLQMQDKGFHPDEVTFVCLLNACGHSGLLDEAQTLLQNMTRQYGVIPSREHYLCMMMAFGRAGHFKKAISVIEMMLSSPFHHLPVWLTLLAACREWGNQKLGKLAFDQIVQLDRNCATAYVLIANIFAAAGMEADAQRTEAMRLKYASLGEARKIESCCTCLL